MNFDEFWRSNLARDGGRDLDGKPEPTDSLDASHTSEAAFDPDEKEVSRYLDWLETTT
jgi:hypothetical protein